MAFIDGRVDDARVLGLARPLMAIAWWDRERPRLAAPRHEGIDAAYAIVRVAHSAEIDVGKTVSITLDPEGIARLAAGDLTGAVAVCLRRLSASGLAPTVRLVAGNARRGRRIAASLAFPIRAVDATRCASLVTKPYELEDVSDAH
jgi:CRISPR-associated protein Csx17